MSIEFEDQNEERIISTSPRLEDEAEGSLRPRQLDDFIGQDKVKDNLKVFIEAARGTGSCAALWSSRPWKNNAREHHRKRDGCEYPHHLRPCH